MKTTKPITHNWVVERLDDKSGVWVRCTQCLAGTSFFNEFGDKYLIGSPVTKYYFGGVCKDQSSPQEKMPYNNDEIANIRIGLTHDLEAYQAAGARLNNRLEKAREFLKKIEGDSLITLAYFNNALKKAKEQKGRKGLAAVRKMSYVTSGVAPWAGGFSPETEVPHLLRRIEACLGLMALADNNLRKLREITMTWKGYVE